MSNSELSDPSGDEVSIRTAGTAEAPLYCVKDVCCCLGIGNPSSKCGGKRKRSEIGEFFLLPAMTQIGVRKLLFTTEAGVERLISEARMPHETRKAIYGKKPKDALLTIARMPKRSTRGTLYCVMLACTVDWKRCFKIGFTTQNIAKYLKQAYVGPTAVQKVLLCEEFENARKVENLLLRHFRETGFTFLSSEYFVAASSAKVASQLKLFKAVV